MEWISKQEHDTRVANYEKYEMYYDGLDEKELRELLPDKVKQSLTQSLKTSLNICKVVVDARTQYLCGKPVQIVVAPGKDGTVDDPRLKDAERTLYRIYNNRFNYMTQENMGKLITTMGIKGDGFVYLFFDPTMPKGNDWGVIDQIQLRVLRPENCVPKYKDDDYQRMEYIAIKSISYDEQNVPTAKMQVWYEDRIEHYEAYNVPNTQHSDYVLKETEDNPYGFIPILHIKNTVTDREFGGSDILPISDVQNGINKTITDMMATMDNQAFQRIVVKGVLAKGAKLSLSPGTFIQFADAESGIDTIEPGDISGYLNALSMMIENGLMIAQVPIIAIGGKSAASGLSGYALRVQYMSLENKCSTVRETIRNQFKTLNEYIFKMLKIFGGADYTDLEAEIMFQDGLPVDAKQQVETVSMKINAGLMSSETGMQELGIEDVEEEQKRIQKEKMDIYGGVERIGTEANAIANVLGETQLTVTPQEE